MMASRHYLVVGLVVGFAASAMAQQSPSIVQDEHDKQIRLDTKRNTEYHNNADDYPKNPPTPSPARETKPAAPYLTSTDIHNMYADADAAAAAREAEFSRALSGAQSHNEADMLKVADYLLRGYGVKADKESAMAVYGAVAKLGPAQAYRIGLLLSQPGPAADNVEAWRAMKEAASGGVPEAKAWIATHPEPVRHAGELPSMLTFADEVFRARGVGVKPTKPGEGEKALAELEKVFAEKYTNWKKSYRVKRDALEAGKATLYGVGVPADPKRAVVLLRAAQGGETGMEAEETEYLGWAEYAAAKQSGGQDYSGLGKVTAGRADSSYVAYLDAVYSCATGKPYKQRAALEKAKESTYNKSTKKYVDGPLQAKADFAVMELEGAGGPQDERAGVDDLTKAATAGNANAKYVLGLLYQRGTHGVAKDLQKTANLFQAAATAGQADAKKELSQTAMAKP